MNKEDEYVLEKENINKTEENHLSDHQNKNSTAPEDDNISDDASYANNQLLSEDDYEEFAFEQDVTCNRNDKAGIHDSWILLDS